jgi:high-affinity Fe2+/Pb2+ permease
MRMATLPRTRIRARRASAIPAAHALARAGLTARGIIYILIGLVAVDKALLSRRNQAAEPVLLVLVALGLVVFGVYGLCEARWRRV